MKKIAYALFAAAVLLFGAMCAVTAYQYRDILCGMQHMGYSVPPSAAFLYAIPFLIGIAACAAVGIMLMKKSEK